MDRVGSNDWALVCDIECHVEVDGVRPQHKHLPHVEDLRPLDVVLLEPGYGLDCRVKMSIWKTQVMMLPSLNSCESSMICMSWLKTTHIQSTPPWCGLRSCQMGSPHNRRAQSRSTRPPSRRGSVKLLKLLQWRMNIACVGRFYPILGEWESTLWWR